MARAPYSPETLARVRSLAAGCQGVNAISLIIEWPPEDLRRVCHKHQIALTEDVLAKPAAKPRKASPSPVVPAPKQPPLTADRVRERAASAKPSRTSKYKIRSDALEVHPRTINCSILISRKAHGALYEVGKQHGKTAGVVLAISIDYAARHGWAEELFLAAIAEIEAQP